ncbi:MAG: hypothetical protein ACYTEQ_25930 [Planctomycetota bacterium]
MVMTKHACNCIGCQVRREEDAEESRRLLGELLHHEVDDALDDLRVYDDDDGEDYIE